MHTIQNKTFLTTLCFLLSNSCFAFPKKKKGLTDINCQSQTPLQNSIFISQNCTHREKKYDRLIKRTEGANHKLSGPFICGILMTIHNKPVINRKFTKCHLESYFNCCRSIVWKICSWSPACTTNESATVQRTESCLSVDNNEHCQTSLNISVIKLKRIFFY